MNRVLKADERPVTVSDVRGEISVMLEAGWPSAVNVASQPEPGSAAKIPRLGSQGN